MRDVIGDQNQNMYMNRNEVMGFAFIFICVLGQYSSRSSSSSQDSMMRRTAKYGTGFETAHEFNSIQFCDGK